MKEIEEMTEMEIDAVRMSTLYELRLLISSGDKEAYSKEEIVKLLDNIASAKD